MICLICQSFVRFKALQKLPKNNFICRCHNEEGSSPMLNGNYGYTNGSTIYMIEPLLIPLPLLTLTCTKTDVLRWSVGICSWLTRLAPRYLADAKFKCQVIVEINRHNNLISAVKTWKRACCSLTLFKIKIKALQILIWFVTVPHRPTFFLSFSASDGLKFNRVEQKYI